MVTTGLRFEAGLIAGFAPAFTLLASETATLFSSLDLAAIPLFLMMGAFATVAGLSEDLYRIAYAFVGIQMGWMLRPFLGSPDAPVTLVEYADLQCPFCAEWARGTFPAIVDEYVRPGQVRIEFRGLAERDDRVGEIAREIALADQARARAVEIRRTDPWTDSRCEAASAGGRRT